MGLTYSNKALGYKNARKNNDAKQWEHTRKYTIRTYRFTII